MMDKMLNRYFDKVVESEFNQQRMRSEQWRQKRTLFDSYMVVVYPSLTCVDIKCSELTMRTYCCNSFEDNVVYNAKIDRQFTTRSLFSL